MRQRTARRKRMRADSAVKAGEEPPDPISLLAIAGITGAVGGIATPFISKALAPKAPKMPNMSSPLAGEDTALKPGQKVNAINTSPQGILDPASTGRKTLLGG